MLGSWRWGWELWVSWEQL